MSGRCRQRSLHSLMVGLALLLLAPAAWGQALDQQMQRVAMRFVEETGDSVMGVGSWMGSPRFDALASDFDMRLVVGGANEPALRAKWEASRRTMTRLIQEEFGERAPDILRRTNLYPPQQLMRGVEGSTDALETFQRLRSVPNLGHTGPVTEQSAARFSEGLYGTGADTYIQSYERTSGRLFYMNNGKATTGLAELAHLGEGAPRYTIAGTANTCGQWAQEGFRALDQGSARDVAKYLARMDRDLAKARDLSRLTMDVGFREKVRVMGETLSRNPGQLSNPQVQIEIKRMLMRAQAEAAILTNYQHAGTLKRAYLRVMMDGVAARNAVGEAMERVMEALPPGVNAQNAIRLIVLISATRSTAQALGGGDSLDALSTGMFNLTMMGGSTFPPALLAYITAEIMKEAQASGLVMAAGSQNAWDLLCGVYSAWGRADVDPDPRFNRHVSLADLVANYQHEDRLKRRVEFMARRAATRGLGTRNEQTDEGVARAIVDQCWPVIRDAWRWERDLLTYEYLHLRSEVIHSTLLITYLPNNPKPNQRVLCTVAPVADPPEQHLRRMDEIIRILYGSDAGVFWNYSWEPGGSSEGARGGWQRSLSFSQPGEYPVKARLEFQARASHPQTEPRVMREGRVESLVDVRVEGDRPPGGVWVLTEVRRRDSYENRNYTEYRPGRDSCKASYRHSSGDVATYEASWTVPPSTLPAGGTVALRYGGKLTISAVNQRPFTGLNAVTAYTVMRAQLLGSEQYLWEGPQATSTITFTDGVSTPEDTRTYQGQVPETAEPGATLMIELSSHGPRGPTSGSLTWMGWRYQFFPAGAPAPPPAAQPDPPPPWTDPTGGYR